MICHIHRSILFTVSKKSTLCSTLLIKEVIVYQEFQIMREQELPQVIYNRIGIACMRFMRSCCLINSRSCKGKLHVSFWGRSGNNISMSLTRLFLKGAVTVLIVIQKIGSKQSYYPWKIDYRSYQNPDYFEETWKENKAVTLALIFFYFFTRYAFLIRNGN